MVITFLQVLDCEKNQALAQLAWYLLYLLLFVLVVAYVFVVLPLTVGLELAERAFVVL